MQQRIGTDLAVSNSMNTVEASSGTDFSYLDQDSVQVQYADGLTGIRFYVGGMSCSKCVRKLESLALQVPGVKSVRVDLGRSLLFAEIDTARITYSELARQISALGFEPIPLAREAEAEQAQRRADRQELIRLGVAAACAGNIMTFGFATYFGAAAEFSSLFAWLSFFLYLPVVTYVAVPFYKGALNSLKAGSLSIDLPMAVASVAGFIFSTVELLRGRDDLYFDSLSGFLFLILAARFTQRRLQRRFLNVRESADSLQLSRVRRVDAKQVWSWVPLAKLAIGDRIRIEADETLPADAQLEGRPAHFSLAWLSGEVKAKIFFPGAIVPAGARLRSGHANLSVRKKLPDTEFGQILQKVANVDLSKAQAVTLADRWAQILLTVVFVAAGLFLLLYWPVSYEEAIRRSLALIILACPCAMAFGTPLAFAAAFSRARRRGLWIRDPGAFEKANGTKTIFFDKTGTLTEAEITLVEDSEPTPERIQKIVLALENQSMHPIAFAFRRAFDVTDPLPHVAGFLEVPGDGVSGQIGGRFYELRRSDSPGGSIGCTLFESLRPIAQFNFAARLKPDSKEVLTSLRKAGYRLVLLSGDGKESVQALAKDLGFSEGDVHFAASPNDKARIVAEAEGAMMVGDGINDSLAMLAARVAVSTSGGVEAALKSSDVYLTRSSLKGVSDLLRISKDSIGLVRQNLTISLVYNSVAGALALLGYVNPFVAAILMPVSSGFILLSTWARSRN